MKILLINQAFVAPNEPGHTRHYELGRHLIENGHEFTVIASNVNYQTGSRILEEQGLGIRQVIDNIEIIRSYILPSLHRSFFWRIISFISFMLTSTINAFRVGDVDVIMGTSPPIFQAASAWLVSAIRRKPYLLEVRDLWPEFAVDMGVLKNPILISLSRWLELFLYRRAKHIVVNSPAYVDYLESKGVPANKISFIAYGTDVEMFNPTIDGSRIREELGTNGKFLAVYAGALGIANDISTLLKAAEEIDSPDIQIAIFGDGKERDNLEKMATELELKNVTFAGVKPKNEMPDVIAAADVCIAILQDIPMFGMVYPNKVFDYMAAGRPTILAIDGVIREVIEDAQGGIFVKPGDKSALANAITKLHQDRNLTATIGESTRQYVVENFDREVKMQEFVNMLETLLD